MKLFNLFACAFVALFGLVSSEVVSIDGYNKELFTVNLIETKRYTVEGQTCKVDMIYLDGSCSGDYFNGELIFEDSSTVVKQFKDGRIESIARFFVNGTDIDNNASRIHLEDIFVGYDENERAITRPNIIVENEKLAWLQTADVIGIMEKTEEGRRVQYLWNESNKKPYPVTELTPRITEEFTKRILTIDVQIPGLGFDGIRGPEGASIGKLGFTCSANTTDFTGVGLDYFVDSRYDYTGQPQKISARYIIEGVDNEGTPMRIFVENMGTDDFGDNKNVQTEPFIVTDNPKWAWIEKVPIHGTHSDVALQIFFWTVEDAVTFEQPEETDAVSSDEEVEVELQEGDAAADLSSDEE